MLLNQAAAFRVEEPVLCGDIVGLIVTSRAIEESS